MKAPKQPSAVETASAQTASNQSTALSQQLLNMVNQSTPYGSLTYNQSGTASYFDPSLNKYVELPRFTATTTLNPQQQALLNQQNQFDQQYNQIGLQQLGAIGGQLAKPFKYDVGDYEKWAGGLYDKLNSPNDARQAESMRQTLANQGLQPGSAAYNDAYQNLVAGQSNARNRFMLDAYDTGMNTALTMRNQPFNEIGALMSGGQVQQPSFVGTPSTSVAGTDIAGQMNSNYQNANQNYQNTMGGLFGLGSAALGGWMMSDKRLKADIKEEGKTPIKGVKAYSYRYKGSPLRQLGVMAQEVAKKVPEAVKTTASGYKAVNYSKLAEAMAA